MEKKLVLYWSKKENDWTINYPDREGSSMCGLIFDMLKIEENISWIKTKFDSNKGEVVNVQNPETLKKILTDRGYDYKSLRMTIKKIKSQ